MTVFNHPPPCAPILTLSHGPHPACAAHVRNLNAAPGACSPHDMSRPVSTSACGLAMEPSNGVHTTPTQVTHNHHHHHHHHHHPPLAFTPPTHLATHPDDRPRSAEHFIAEGECGAVGRRGRRESKSASGDASHVRHDLHVQFTHTTNLLPHPPPGFAPASNGPCREARRRIGVCC